MLINLFERFIPLWLFLSLLIVIYIFYSERKNISVILRPIIKKKHLLIIFVVFVIILFLRLMVMNTSSCVFEDNFESSALGGLIASKGVFRYLDSPGFPILTAIFSLLFGINYSISSVTNIFLGSLSVILVYLVVSLYSKKSLAGLVSAIITAFLVPHFVVSVSGFSPIASSIFFMLLSFLIIYFVLIEYKTSFLLALGIILGFTFQIYFFEIIIIIPVIYLLRNVSFKRLALLFGVILLVMLPSLLYQDIYFADIDSFDPMKLYLGPKAFKQSSFVEENLLGVDNPRLRGLIAVFLGLNIDFVFTFNPCGLGTIYGYFQDMNILYTFSLTSILVTFLALFSYRQKSSFLFFINFLVLLVLLAFDISVTESYWVPALILGLVPLAGIGFARLHLNKNEFIRRFLIFILIIIIWLFFSSGIIFSYKDFYGELSLPNKVVHTELLRKCSERHIQTGFFYLICDPFLKSGCTAEYLSDLRNLIVPLQAENFVYKNLEEYNYAPFDCVK